MAPKLAGGKSLGTRQSLGLVKPKAKPKPDPSKLGAALVELYRQGKVSARGVGDTSASAASSFESPAPDDIVQLAKAKATGQEGVPKAKASKIASKNSARALHRVLRKSGSVRPGELYVAKVPLWSHDQIQAEELDLAFLPIH